MFFLFRVIILFLLCIAFVVIVFTSFFSEAEYFDTPQMKSSIERISDPIVPKWSTMKIQNISNFETFFSSQDVTLNQNEDSVIVDVRKPGKYVSSFRDLRKEYIFTWTWYTIQQEWVGEIFIDTLTDTNTVFVMSKNTPLSIILQSDDGTEKYTDIFLHPHMYLIFQPKRGSFLKNADALRVETVYQLGYLGLPTSQIDQNTFLKKYSEGAESFFQTSLKYIQKQDTQKEQVLDAFLQSNITQISGFSLLKRYMYVFVNTEKKKTFYKNIVLSGLVQIMRSQEYNQNYIDQLKQDFETLRGIDIVSYNELLKLKEEYMSIVMGSSKKEFIVPKIALSSLYHTQEIRDTFNFPVESFVLYQEYNVTQNFSPEVTKLFLESFRTYTQQNTFQDTAGLRYQYFAYLLEQQLRFLLQTHVDEFSITSLSNLLKNHIDITENFYTAEKNTRISMMYSYADILEQIALFLRTNYFNPARDKEGLLVSNLQRSMLGNQRAFLKTQIERVYALYDENKKFLLPSSSRDRAIASWITESRSQITEYFSALNNYESYVSEYDLSKKNLLNINTFWSKEDTSLTESKLRQYMAQFKWVSLDDASITVNPNSYEVKGAYVRWETFDFTLFPDAEHRIQDMSIAKKLSPFVYKLDIIQDEWNEKFSSASIEEKELFDFERFFIITFFTNTINRVEEFDDPIVSPNEDKTEIVFKRDILLGSKWEFSSIQDILPLEYKNIRVKKDNDLYDIFIESAALATWTTGSYRWVMDAEYVLSDTDHYFENIELRIYSGSETNIQPVFQDTQLQISGRVQLTDFPGRIEAVFRYIDEHISLYQALRNTYWANNIVMQYSSRMWKMTFKFDLQEKKYTILSSWESLESLYKGTQKLTSEAISIEDLENYLQ